jgi:hypothetical protein
LHAAAPSGLSLAVARSPVERFLVPFLLLNVLAATAVYVVLLAPILAGDDYAPAWTDEYGYVLDARSFAANGTLHAARVKEESVSRVFAAGTHGPAYILLQGTLARVAGDPVALSLWPNVVALALALVLVLAFPATLAERLAIVLLLLLHFAVFLYAFTWMVESVQVPFAVGATLLLVSLYRAPRDSAVFRRRLVAWIVLLLVLSTFRATYALWALGLLPLARDRRELVRHALLTAAVVVAATLAMQVLSAPNPYWPLSRAVALLRSGEVATPLAMLARNVAVNARRYFVDETQGQVFYLAMKWLVVVLGVALAVGAVRRRDRLALAAVLILGAHLTLLFGLYDAHTWREHRHLAPAFYALTIVLVLDGWRRTTAVLYVVLVLLFPFVVAYATRRIIPERRFVAAQLAEQSGLRAALAQLADVVEADADGPVTVLHAKGFYRNLSVFPLALPVRSAAGRPIRYTANLGATPDWRRFGRIAIDYALAPPELAPRPGWRLVARNEYFALYDVRPAGGAGAGARGTPRSSAGASSSRLASSPRSPRSAARSPS